jgi:hypothetical protein
VHVSHCLYWTKHGLGTAGVVRRSTALQLQHQYWGASGRTVRVAAVLECNNTSKPCHLAQRLLGLLGADREAAKPTIIMRYSQLCHRYPIPSHLSGCTMPPVLRQPACNPAASDDRIFITRKFHRAGPGSATAGNPPPHGACWKRTNPPAHIQQQQHSTAHAANLTTQPTY